MNLIDENKAVRNTLFNIPGLIFLCPSCQNSTVVFTQRYLSITPNKSSLLPHDNNFTLGEKDNNGNKDNLSLGIQSQKRMLPAAPNVMIRNQNSNSLSQNSGRTDFMQKKFHAKKFQKGTK